MEAEDLKASDLLTAFMARWVLPLQARPHIISRMSGHQDPCRMCTKELPDVEVVRLVNYFSNCKLSEKEWRFGEPPYSRAHPLTAVSLLILFLFIRPGSFLPPDQSVVVQIFSTQSVSVSKPADLG